MSLKKIIVILVVVLILIIAVSCSNTTKARLKNSVREDKNGWVFVHLEGTPREVGFQHGYHLAAEIDDALEMFAFYLEEVTKRDWKFYREAAERMFWPKLEQEYREEIEEIAEGIKARLPDKNYDKIDITALNGWIELAWYYGPYLDEKIKAGAPEFMRARKAAQYASSIDDFVRIMTTDNNGAYANDWLVGDTKTNEIAKLKLGLKNHRVWRTKDGYFIGSNFASDEKLIAEETTFNPQDTVQSVFVRKARWEQLMEENKGNINAEMGKAFEADHLDASLGSAAANSNVLCGHVDEDPKGLPEFSWAPYFPGGSVQGKVTTAALAKDMKIWARMGHPCGRDFIAAAFFEKHPEYEWQGKFLKDMKSNAWTMFEAKK